MIIDLDDFGSNHVISDVCQSHDCRGKLDQLHYINHEFKVTLFAIPGEMTAELCEWCKANSGWVELALHGFYHRDNWECSKMSYEEFDDNMGFFKPILDEYFVKGFKAPGWQISDDIYRWLDEHGWWVSDQSYNNDRRPEEIHAYVNDNGEFYYMFTDKFTKSPEELTLEDASPKQLRHRRRMGIDTHLKRQVKQHVPSWHGHTWDCVGNGIYESFEHVSDVVKNAKEFKFISEVV